MGLKYGSPTHQLTQASIKCYDHVSYSLEIYTIHVHVDLSN